MNTSQDVYDKLSSLHKVTASREQVSAELRACEGEKLSAYETFRRLVTCSKKTTVESAGSAS